MAHLAGPKWNTPAVFTLQFRCCPWGEIVAYGIENSMRDALDFTLTEEHVEQAQAKAQKSCMPYFHTAMWESVVAGGRYMPLRVYAVADGTMVAPGDPIMRVEGPLELAAHIEPLLHRVFYPSLVASHARWVTQLVGAHRVAEFGYRSAINDEMHDLALDSLFVGGGISRTSSDLASDLYATVGTVAHRFVQGSQSVESAYDTQIAHMKSPVLLVDTENPIDGIKLALKKQAENLEKAIAMRIDSGNVVEQLRFIFEKYAADGGKKPEQHTIIVSCISSDEHLQEVENSLSEKEKSFVHYGIGNLLIAKNKTREAASSAYKLSEMGGRAVMKWSGTPEKQSLPGRPTLAEKTDEQRIISQVGEYETDLLELAYDHGQFLREHNLEAARHRVKASPVIALQTQKSPQTTALTHSLRVTRSAVH